MILRRLLGCGAALAPALLAACQALSPAAGPAPAATSGDTVVKVGGSVGIDVGFTSD